MTHISVSDVRYASGVPVKLASNTAIEHAISIVEDLTARKMNTKFVPTEMIDIIDGNGTNRFITEKNPLLKVLKLSSDDTDIDVTTLKIYKDSGKIALGPSSDVSYFVEKQQSVACKYLYGLLIEASARTTTTADVEAGTSVVVSVSSATGLAANDWIEIYGMDGYREVAQISSIAGSDITVDELTLDHESGSVFVKLEISSEIKRFIELEAAIYVAIMALGATYEFNASYNVGDFNAVKGVPYTHWRESFMSCVKEREGLRHIIRPRPRIV